jgi:hypothetical protein
MKIGINKMRGFMKQICHIMDLSKEYKNHSIRATAITILGESFQDTDVAAVSGHKSLTNLTIYKRTTNDKKSQMSSELHKAYLGESSSSRKPCKSSPSPIIDDYPSSSHRECCISYGANSSASPIIKENVSFDLPMNEELIDVDAIEDFIHNFDTSGDTEIAPKTNNSTIVTNNQHYEMTTRPEVGLITEPRSMKNELLKISDKAFIVKGSKCSIVFNVNINK